MPGSDAIFMQAALVHARQAALEGEAPVGAVVRIGNEIVAAGHNRTVADHDPSGHAEIVVLRDAGRTVDNHRLVNATLYVTLEPCAMCVGAIVQARLARVVFGAYDPKAGALGSAIDLSDSPAFNHRFEIQGGVLAADCAAVLQEFFAARR
ncbi:MAG: tRNA adenosine(34) deaminase TadA [Proteobacteria bacterium]|nr:tRNA adenosine(34) deaminase TadA [Pseudomonadota bacterium]